MSGLLPRGRLWHGSGLAPSEDGLSPVDIARVLGSEGIEADDPRVAEYVQAKERHRWVYLTGDRREASSYAAVGGNFPALIRTELGLPASGGWLYEVDPARVGELRSLYVPPEAILSVECVAPPGRFPR